MKSSEKITNKKLFELRNKIFIESGIPSLEKNGFAQSPFSTAWFGKNNLGDYTYELCRISQKSNLEIVETYISKTDIWIQVHLNIFELHPDILSIEQLKGKDGMKFHLPPNSKSNMRLRVDDIRGIPLFNYQFMFGGHKLKSSSNEKSLNKSVEQLSGLIKKDLTNIDAFVKRWHELHQPNVTDWNGNRIDKL